MAKRAYLEQFYFAGREENKHFQDNRDHDTGNTVYKYACGIGNLCCVAVAL